MQVAMIEIVTQASCGQQAIISFRLPTLCVYRRTSSMNAKGALEKWPWIYSSLLKRPRNSAIYFQNKLKQSLTEER